MNVYVCIYRIFSLKGVVCAALARGWFLLVLLACWSLAGKGRGRGGLGACFYFLSIFLYGLVVLFVAAETDMNRQGFVEI